MMRKLMTIALLAALSGIAYGEETVQQLSAESQTQAAATDDAGYADWAAQNVRANAGLDNGTTQVTTVTVTTQITVTRVPAQPAPAPVPAAQPAPAPVVQPAPAPAPAPAVQPAPQAVLVPSNSRLVDIHVNVHNLIRYIPDVHLDWSGPRHPRPARPAPVVVTPAPVYVPAPVVVTPAPVVVTPQTVAPAAAPVNDERKFGGFGGPAYEATFIAGNPVFLSGGQGAMIFKHTLILGGAGYGFSSENYPAWESGSTFGAYSLGYGGPMIGLRLFGKSPLHVTFTALAGVGAIGYTDSGTSDKTYEPFAFVEPGIELGLTIFKFMELSAGIQYRYAVNLTDAHDWSALYGSRLSDIEGYSAKLSVTFGAF